MGDMSRWNRADRFMKEFGDELTKALTITGPVTIKNQNVGYDELNAEVRYYLLLAVGEGDEIEEIEVDTGQFIFDSEYSEVNDIVEGLEQLLGISEEEAQRRLEKADLFDFEESK